MDREITENYITFISLFPFFLSVGSFLSAIFYYISNSQELVALLGAYSLICIFFAFINCMNISYALRVLFNKKRNFWKDFVLILISLGLYIPFYLLALSEIIGKIRKLLVYFSFFFPFPCFFLWCYFFYRTHGISQVSTHKPFSQ